MQNKGKLRQRVYRLKAKIHSHRLKNGNFTFTIILPLRCSVCGSFFKRQVQVGVDNPVVPCPFCYSRNKVKLQWYLKGNLAEGKTAEVILHE
ncbi:hypothetical protein J7K97_02520 [Candidatus Aerophobetes bacterium]|nr:hypothetical protein [Candidatus Aerophobetes bacterium]